MSQCKEKNYKTVEYEIARLDRQIILYLAQRFRYMKLAKKMKNDNKSNSINHFKLMLEQRKAWALSAGFDRGFVNKLSQYLIDYYLTEEI